MEQKNLYNQIESSFYILNNMRTPDFINCLIGILDEYTEEFGILGYTFNHASKPRYKPLNKDHIINEICKSDKRGDVFFGGNEPYEFKLWCDIRDGNIIGGRYDFSSVRIDVSRKYFLCRDNAEKQKRLKTYLKFCRELYDLLQPLCGETHDTEDSMAVSVSLGKSGMFSFLGLTHSTEFACIRQPHIDCPVTGIYWANYFGQGCTSFFGRSRILKAPGLVGIEELNDGGLLLLTAPDPLTPDNPKHRANQLALWKYLGLSPRPRLKMIASFKADNWKGVQIKTEFE